MALGHFAVAAARAERPGAIQHRLRKLAQLGGLAGEAMALRHGGAIITRVSDEIVSKTRRKREMTELQQLGAALVQIPEGRLDFLPEELRQAVLDAKRITSHEARRRQLQYIGRLMRTVDPEPIRARLAEIAGGSAQAAARHRRLEGWRTRLLEDDGALTEFAAEHPGADLQALRALIRNARKEQKEGKPPRAFRELFRLIKECNSNPS
jgi:ribosome-associated protein